MVQRKVLREAKKHDPKRERTLGIITKPDKLDEDSPTEQLYLRLAQNDEASHKLALGWHVLRNRAPREITCTDEERDEEEKRFFDSGVWSAISSHDRGVDTLREKLSHVLLGHIQRKLPGLVTKIEDHINNRQTRLKKLGDQRSSTEDVKKYLINISSRYQRVAREAVQGRYGDEFFGGLYPGPESSYEDRRVRKLRALIRDLNRAFYFVLKTRGARRHILWVGDEDTTAGADDDRASKNDANPPETSPPKYLEPLVGLYKVGERIEISIEDLTDELDRMASENQGVEFPSSSNDKIALNLFRDQSQSWEPLANQHVDLVTHFARGFAEKIVSHVVGPDSKTSEAVVKNLVTPYFDEKHAVLRAKVVELLQHYKQGYDPQPTMYDDFVDRVTERRDKRLIEHMIPRIEDANPGGERSREALLDVLKTSKISEFNAEHTIDNAITYYEMSLRVFTDNIMILALENCLISDIPNILSPDKVYGMSDETVEALAAESKQIQRERDELQSQLEKLRKGLAACRGYGPNQPSAHVNRSRLGPRATGIFTPGQCDSPSDTFHEIHRQPSDGTSPYNRRTIWFSKTRGPPRFGSFGQPNSRVLEFCSLKGTPTFTLQPPGTVRTAWLYDIVTPQTQWATLQPSEKKSSKVEAFKTIVSADVLKPWSEEELRVADYQDELVPRQYVPSWLIRERENKGENERVSGAKE
ncbi:hypothetical protein B0T18DRAFT_392225 [Schizothecium vesticola]|uniref:GED domain-containing protein n=1 Tax=Schizothecium vesticola TaxID=314040 RepID=A0AA40K2N9_9PEZI|nr:hypothetical protein B0T18DRAFT_392225 [Schizothecium vesticola]